MKYIFVLMLLISTHAHGQSSLAFGSKSDFFSLSHEDGKYTFNGEEVSLGLFAEYLPLFKQEFFDPCENLPAKPDLNAKWIQDGNETTRQFYVKQKTIRAGNKCLVASGEGIYYIPLHRSWFTGPKQNSINFSKQTEFNLPDGTKFSTHFILGEWASSSSDFFVAWDFFDRFIDSLKNYSVDFRLHPAAGDDKTHFQVISGKTKYEFYKIADNLWAVKKPGQNWLEASKAWSFWLEMEKHQWADRHTAEIKFILDKGKGLPERIGALNTLKNSWSKSIKFAVQKIVLDPEEKSELKFKAIEALRQKPSLDNFGVLIKSLRLTKDLNLLQATTAALKVRNPKGPSITEDTEEKDLAPTIREWEKWWKDVSHSQDSKE